MKPVIHAAAATTVILVIATFWVSTVASELLFDQTAIAAVKRVIAIYGLAILVPALALTGATGFALARARKGALVAGKTKRMPFIALNGMLVLVPAALYLYYKSGAGEFDTLFHAVQAIELGAGLTQLVLMSLNFRDGLRLAGRAGHIRARGGATG